MQTILSLIAFTATCLAGAVPRSSTTTTTSVVKAPVQEQCSYVGGSQCCETVDVPGPEEIQTLLSVVNVAIDSNTLVGHGCSPLIGIDATCNAQAVCCEESYGAIYIGCNNISV